MELKGKRIAFLGDSITEGVGVSAPEHIYWQVLARHTGAQAFGYGISATRIAPQRFPTVNAPWEDQHFASRVEAMEENMDVVVVFGGTNDYGHGDAAIGCITDTTEDTFFGAYHVLVQKLMRKYPCATLVLMTPLHRADEDRGYYNERGIRLNGPLSAYAQAIREIAAYYGLALVDLHRDCPIQPAVEQSRLAYAPDGLHPNDAGAALVAHCLQRKLESL